MPTTERITPAELRQKRSRGESPLLVCAYDDPQKCQQNSIEGAIDYQTFEKRLPTLSKDQEIIFYCA